MMNDSDFWNSSETLRYIRDYARAKGVRVAPWALLFSVLARVCAATPPNVVIPALAGGSAMSLNFYVALIGASGDGKGLTEHAARQLVPDIRQAITTQPASGEGLATIYTRHATDDEGNPTVECASCRALLSIPEIATLGGTAKRVGSTVVPTLTSAYSGERLGGWNKSESNRFSVPEYGYRVSLITGVQPANVKVLMNEVGTGLPQRFVWASVRDPEAPEQAPDRPATPFVYDSTRLPADPSQTGLNTLYKAGSRYDMLNHGDTNYPLTLMRFPDCAVKAVETDSYMRLRGTRGNELDAHGIGVRLKLAALFALLDYRLEVTEADWQLAAYAYDRSAMFRAECIREGERVTCKRKAEAIALDDEAREQAQRKKLEQAKQYIVNYLNNHDPNGEGVRGYVIRRSCGRNYRFADDAIQSLYAEGRIEPASIETENVGATDWRLAN